ncbi:MAG: response regulator transcription factor [Pseudobutyrivibrio ruminis]|nr:response regulator transcription factor [Pseudobutyrivibrio ruminis]
MEIRVAIVEDEDMCANTLHSFIDRYQKENPENVFFIKRYRDGDEIVDEYKGDFDLIFMDIEMQFMDGMKAAENIRLRDKSVEIIFVTNMAKYAILGYKVRAMDYVLKPIKYETFKESLKRVIAGIEGKEEKYIVINQKDGAIKVAISEIKYIESLGHRLTFHLKDNQVETTVFSMKQMEEALNKEGFCRCNSGCLVNLKYVKGFKDREVLIDDDRLSISRSRRQEFMEQLVSRMSY